MKFEQFCEQVPRADDVLRLINTPPLEHVEAGLPEFVPPRLSPHRGVEQSPSPRVIVVSAAGAVGKSTVARELANRARQPYWDLAKYGVVGEGALWGALKKSLGASGVGRFSSGLSDGVQALIVDALDEARLKTNEAGFEDFVRDIAEAAAEGTNLSFVLFGRNEIAETTWLLLDEFGIELGFYSIDAFSRDEAQTFVDGLVPRLSKDAAARIEQHRGPYRRARDLLLDGLQQAIAGSQNGLAAGDEASRFVGYAPVLRAIATLLADEPNFASLEARLTTEWQDAGLDGTSRGPVRLLSEVMEWILDREHKSKLLHNIRPALATLANNLGWSDWGSLYTPAEQRARLISRLLGKPYRPQHRLPGALDSEYEQRLAVFLPEHPFLRDNDSVFTSYLLAWSLLHVHDGSVEEFLARRDYKPSRLVADFYFFERDRAEGSDGALPHSHIGLLYDALVAGESDRLAVRATLDADVDAVDGGLQEVDGELEVLDLTTLSEDEPRSTSYAFTTLVRQQDVISFGRHLRDATIVVPCVLELGAAQDEFKIGPSVAVRADTIRLLTGKLIAGGRTKKRPVEEADDGVILEAHAVDDYVTERPTAYVDLSVRWPGCEKFPWSDFANPGELARLQDERLVSAYRRFRRIIMTLRSHSKGSLARYKGKIEHARVLQGAVGSALLQKLLVDGVLYLQGSFYHLAPERAHELTETSWVQLRKGDQSGRLIEYLREFVEAHEELFE